MSIESKTAESRIAKLPALEARVLDDRHQARPEEAETLAQGDRRREGGYVDGEISRGHVEPLAEERRHVRIAGEHDRAVFTAEPAEHRSRSALLVDDEPTDDDVGARCHMTFQPVGGAGARHVPSVTPLGDDALEAVFGDDFEEWFAVVIQMLRHRKDARPEAGAEETRTALRERPRDERSALGIEQVERDEDRAAAAFRGLRTEPTGEKVVARTAARVADDDLAVEDDPVRQAE